MRDAFLIRFSFGVRKSRIVKPAVLPTAEFLRNGSGVRYLRVVNLPSLRLILSLFSLSEEPIDLVQKVDRKETLPFFLGWLGNISFQGRFIFIGETEVP